MPDSTQSFTLDEIERQRILDLMPGSYSGGRDDSDEVFGQGQAWQAPVSPQEQSSLEESSRTKVVRDHSLSPESLRDILSDGSLPNPDDMHVSPEASPASCATQEDPASLRDEVDQAPVLERQVSDISNAFDEEAPEDSIHSSAILAAIDRGEAPFATPWSSDDEQQVRVKDDFAEVVTTPVTSRSRVQETPGLMTQMFQSSQDTPLVNKHKSAYISMKDSQEHRLQAVVDQDASPIDDDPDFERIRSSRVSFARDRTSAAHTVMQRMRDRSLMHSSGLTVAQHTIPGSSSPSASQLPHHDREMIVPASAEAISTPQQTGQDGDTDEVITDSQPQVTKASSLQEFCSIAESPPAAKETSQPTASQVHSGTSETQADDALPLENVGLDKATNDKVSTIADESLVDSLQPLEAKAFRPINSATVQDGTQDSTSDAPTQMTASSTASTREIDGSISRVRTRSQLNPLELASDPIETSSSRPVSRQIDSSDGGKRISSRNQPDGHEVRRSARARGKRHADVVFSSLVDDLDPVEGDSKPAAHVPSRKRRKLTGEVVDSQICLDEVVSTSTPLAAEALELEVKQTEDFGERDMLKDQPDQDSDDDPVSSPLSSLASDDFLQGMTFDVTKVDHHESIITRVLALDRGRETYRPGTLSVPGPWTEVVRAINVEVIFDHDNTAAKVNAQELRPLNLAIGDVIKIDRKGFKNRLQTIHALHADESGTSKCDIHGNTHLVAKWRDSKARPIFAISEIYVPTTHWAAFSSRLVPSVTNETTQGSLSIQQPSTTREAGSLDVRQDVRDHAGGVFSGLAVTVTIGEQNSSARRSTENRLKAQGAVLLSEGLEELFEPSTAAEEFDIAPLKLTRLAEGYKAAFAISDNPNRKAKYLQALSLSLPCLHYSFIEDCIAEQRILPVGPYMLAAGEGRLRNHSVLMSQSCHTLSLDGIEAQISKRRLLWSGKNIIVVTGHNKHNRQIHLFLSWALGCVDLTDCASLEDAHRLFMIPEKGKRWDLISVPDVPDLINEYPNLSGHIVTNEDVVQSLITGHFCSH